MKKIKTPRTLKVVSILTLSALASLPLFANVTSDGGSVSNSGQMAPGAVIASVALIIGLVVVLAAKGGRRAAQH